MTATTMRAMVLERSPGELRLAELPRPEPGPGQLLIEVRARGAPGLQPHHRATRQLGPGEGQGHVVSVSRGCSPPMDSPAHRP